jgi:hypothetical protein
VDIIVKAEFRNLGAETASLSSRMRAKRELFDPAPVSASR